MKNTLILSLLLAVPAFAGTTQTMTESPPPPPVQDTWNWFIGATGGYLMDFDEDMYTLQIGAKSPWGFGGWNVALYAEGGWTENHEDVEQIPPLFGDDDSALDIIPITFNVKLERLLSGPWSVYVGGGLGSSFIDSEFELEEDDNDSEDDWVFTGQVFAGVAYHATDAVELFAGARWIYFDDPDFANVELGDDVLFEGGLRFHF